MSLLAPLLLLALGWAAIQGDFRPATLIVGFGLGALALWIARAQGTGPDPLLRLLGALRLMLFFLAELVVSSLRVAWDVLTPTPRRRSGIVAVPLEARTPAEILLLANLVSLTPGTLSLELSEDRRTLYVHGMFVDDPDALRREIQHGLERRLLEVMR